jgi:hypothetical protein
MTIRVTLLLLFLCALGESTAQEVLKPRPSPLAISAVRYKDNYLKVTYCQPQRKNRKIFGELVPYGKVWRTGANEATELTTTRDVEVNGRILRAGTYSLFTIPGPERWTIIINSDVGLWGAYNYNAARDVYRFDVPAQPSEKIYDVFTIFFDHRNNLADLILAWDTVQVALPFKFTN